jgi:putative redox protein
MASATVKWVISKTFIGIDSTNHSVVVSTTDDGIGMKPTELMLISVGSCTAVDVVEILAKKRTPLSYMEISVTGEQDPNPPWTFRKIHIHYKVRGNNLTEKNVAQAIHLSHEKYCSVAATLRGIAEMTTDFEIIQS